MCECLHVGETDTTRLRERERERQRNNESSSARENACARARARQRQRDRGISTERQRVGMITWLVEQGKSTSEHTTRVHTQMVQGDEVCYEVVLDRATIFLFFSRALCFHTHTRHTHIHTHSHTQLNTRTRTHALQVVVPSDKPIKLNPQTRQQLDDV